MASEVEILDQEPKVGSPDRDGISGAEADILEKETPEETPEEEVSDEDKLEEGEETPEETKPEEESKPGAPPFNQLRKEFPDIFKKYPQIQANYFKAEKYAEYFPTPEEAGEAAKKAEVFDYFDSSVTQGDLSLVVEAISQNNPNALQKVATEILPMLQQKNSQLYVQAVNPVFKQFLHAGFTKAQQQLNSADQYVKDRGENLKNALAVVANFLYGDAGIPNEPPAQQQPDPEKLQMQQEHQQLIFNTAANFEISTKNETKKELLGLIESGLDPENKLTKFTKDKLTETILDDINQRLMQDGLTKKQMQSLWTQAARTGFVDDSKAQLKRAFLGRAKMIIPAIRQRRLSEALGTAPKIQGKTTIPSNAGSPRPKSAKISNEEVRKKRMTEMDIIKHGA